jgi:CubicO group peptidase (beta-lactamase class C family)
MTQRTRRSVLAGLAGLALGGAGPTTGRTTASRPQRRAKSPAGATAPDLNGLETVVDDTLASRIGDTVAGATVAVVGGGEVALAKGYGRADVTDGTRLRAAETAVRIGSVSKLVTWTAVMQGVEAGILDLDTDVNQYLDDSPLSIPDEYDDPVTLRHLGTHTAGFDIVIESVFAQDPDQLTDLTTTLVRTQPERVRPPGAAVCYSNWGAMLAGHVVAEAFDTTFEEYVQSNVFDPLGMSRSTSRQPVPGGHPGNLAAPHDTSGEAIERVDPVYTGWYPAGSISATATDMAAFMNAHLGHGTEAVFNDATLATMHSEQYGRHPAVNGLRYGFYEHGHPDSDYIGHSGGTIYYSTWLGLLPDRDVGVFVGFNSRGSASPIDVADEILAECDLLPEGTTPEPATGAASRERATTLAGEYESLANAPRNSRLQILGVLSRLTVEATDNGGLITRTMGGEPTEWVETDPYVYHEREGEDVLAADVVDGGVESLYLNSQPTTTFKPVAPHERQAVTLGTVGGSLTAFGLSLAGWTGFEAWRRLKRHRSDGDDDPVPPENGDAAGPTGEGSR